MARPRQLTNAGLARISRAKEHEANRKQFTSTKAKVGKKVLGAFKRRLEAIGGDESLEHFCRALGVPHGTVQGWVQDRKSYAAGTPDLATVCAIAELTNSTVDSLVGIPGAPMSRSAWRSGATLEEGVSDRVLEGLRRGSRGKPWERIVAGAGVDGRRCLEQLVERELERLEEAWAVSASIAATAHSAILEAVAERSEEEPLRVRVKSGFDGALTAADREHRHSKDIAGRSGRRLTDAEFRRRLARGDEGVLSLPETQDGVTP